MQCLSPDSASEELRVLVGLRLKGLELQGGMPKDSGNQPSCAEVLSLTLS